MPFDFAKAKEVARRAIHKTLAVPAFYQDASLNTPIEIRARWHNVIARFGDDERQGYAEIIERIERIVFIPEVWITSPTTGHSCNTGDTFDLKRNGIVTFPAYQGITFTLAVREPNDGPLEQVWQVTRKLT